MEYDPKGRRLSKQVNNHYKQYSYDGWDLIFETDNQSNITRSYVYGPGVDNRLMLIDGMDTYFYHSDGLGSITGLTDTLGNLVQTYDYSVFGKLLTDSGSVDQPFTYTAREWDKELGLYYYRARYYNAGLGRFISEDPIGFAGGDVNLYRYVGNNAVNYTDPSGLYPGEKVIVYIEEFVDGVNDMKNNYNEMKQGNVVGSDQYYHCMANCQATQRGSGGEDAACLVSGVREFSDFPKNMLKGMSASDAIKDGKRDLGVNKLGRNGALGGQNCDKVCRPLLPTKSEPLIPKK